MRSADLERLVDRSLRDLPSPRAPHTLVPRVMAAVQLWAGRPWYAREWLTWPIGWQLASALAAFVVLAGAVLSFQASGLAGSGASVASVLPAVASFVDSLAAGAGADPASMKQAVGDTAAHATATTGAAWVVWRVVMVPFVAYAATIVTLMCVACAALATVLNHLAFGKALSR